MFMELEVEQQVGAKKHERNRIGYRERSDWEYIPDVLPGYVHGTSRPESLRSIEPANIAWHSSRKKILNYLIKNQNPSRGIRRKLVYLIKSISPRGFSITD
jgi:hypothetical protein